MTLPAVYSVLCLNRRNGNECRKENLRYVHTLKDIESKYSIKFQMNLSVSVQLLRVMRGRNSRNTQGRLEICPLSQQWKNFATILIKHPIDGSYLILLLLLFNVSRSLFLRIDVMKKKAAHKV